MTATGADQAFLEIGRHCSEEFCRQLDFLPFKCPCCSLPFCSLHWRPPTGHPCKSYDPTLYDNRVPSCPLCSLPIPLPTLTTDPNIPMDSHLSLSCPTLHPHLAATKKKPTNECQVSKCKTKLVVKMECKQCLGNFCTSHRYASDHGCEERQEKRRREKEEEKKGNRKGFGGIGMFGLSKEKSATSSHSTKKSGGNGIKSGASQPVGQAGLAALRRAQQALSSSTSSSSTTSSTKPIPYSSTSAQKPSTSTNNTGNSSDSSIEIVSYKPTSSKPTPPAQKSTSTRKDSKRAKEEESSARKALEVRYQKGILSESEKVRWAELRAKEHLEGGGGSGGKKDGCVIA